MLIHDLVVTGSLTYNGGSIANTVTGSLATTGSNNFTGSQNISGSLTVQGNIIAQTLVVSTISSSVTYSSGSNIFGNQLTNTQQFTGSVSVTGSGAFSNSITGSSLVTKGRSQNNSNNIRFVRSDNTEMAYIGWTNEAVNNSTWYFKSTNGNPIAFSADGTNQNLLLSSTGAATFSGNSTTVELNTSTRALKITGKDNYYAIEYIGGTTTGQSYGPFIKAGTNSSDQSFVVQNSPANKDYFTVRGDGNVGIGTSSPDTTLTVKNTSWASGSPYGSIAHFVGGAVNDNNWGHVTISQNTTNNGDGGKIILGYGDALANSFTAIAGITGSKQGASYGDLLFWTRPSGGNNTERLRITSGGNVLIGTTTDNSSRLLVVGGTNTFYAKGNTSTSFGAAITAVNSSDTQLLLVRNDGLIMTGTAGASPYNNTTAVAANVQVDSNGYLARSTSSLKYKTDVIDYTKGLSEVMHLRPVSYKGKNDGEKVFAGLIAEEVHELGLTEFVQYANDGTPDALAYQNMVALLTKAIQEQQIIIEEMKLKNESLEQRIAALETK